MNESQNSVRSGFAEGSLPADRDEPRPADRADKATLSRRLRQLQNTLENDPHGFGLAMIVNRLNQYYYTGTMQDGILLLRRGADPIYGVRKSAARARAECPLDIIRPITSYRDLISGLGTLPQTRQETTWVETETMPLVMLERLRRYLPVGPIRALETHINRQRAVKDAGEQALMRECGRRHRQLLEEIAPSLLREGISEAELMAELYRVMIRIGYQGVTRFAMFQIEMLVGQIAFGENSLYPSSFNGAGGMRGMHPAVPLIGSRERRLTRGDLIYLDVAFGYAGYHTDKTQIYVFGGPPPDEVEAVWLACRDLLDQARNRLKPGITPAEIYRLALADRPRILRDSFMGYGDELVPFLGHGIGLNVDEWPPLAEGFNEPLCPGMALAIEPKRGLPGVCMVGVEETYLMHEDRIECLTGGASSIIRAS